MKRTMGAALAAFVGISVLLAPASAGKKPVKTTFYLHGSQAIGETESFSLVADAYLPMSPEEPAAAEPRSKFITNYVAGPNANCAGNNLFPVWTGAMSGRIKGDMKFTFSTVGTPGPVEVRVWPDIMSSLCDSPATGTMDYVDPAGSVVVDLPPGAGTVEALIKDVDFKVAQHLLIQVSPIEAVDLPDPAGSLLSPFMARILYDTPDFASALEFSCVPAKGKTCAS